MASNLRNREISKNLEQDVKDDNSHEDSDTESFSSKHTSNKGDFRTHSQELSTKKEEESMTEADYSSLSDSGFSSSSSSSLIVENDAEKPKDTLEIEKKMEDQQNYEEERREEVEEKVIRENMVPISELLKEENKRKKLEKLVDRIEHICRKSKCFVEEYDLEANIEHFVKQAEESRHEENNADACKTALNIRERELRDAENKIMNLNEELKSMKAQLEKAKGDRVEYQKNLMNISKYKEEMEKKDRRINNLELRCKGLEAEVDKRADFIEEAKYYELAEEKEEIEKMLSENNDLRKIALFLDKLSLALDASRDISLCLNEGLYEYERMLRRMKGKEMKLRGKVERLESELDKKDTQLEYLHRNIQDFNKSCRTFSESALRVFKD